MSAKCLMSLSGHLLRPVGIGPPCFSFIRYIPVLCLGQKNNCVVQVTAEKTLGRYFFFFAMAHMLDDKKTAF